MIKLFLLSLCIYHSPTLGPQSETMKVLLAGSSPAGAHRISGQGVGGLAEVCPGYCGSIERMKSIKPYKEKGSFQEAV